MKNNKKAQTAILLLHIGDTYLPYVQRASPCSDCESLSSSSSVSVLLDSSIYVASSSLNPIVFAIASNSASGRFFGSRIWILHLKTC